MTGSRGGMNRALLTQNWSKARAKQIWVGFWSKKKSTVRKSSNGAPEQAPCDGSSVCLRQVSDKPGISSGVHKSVSASPDFLYTYTQAVHVVMLFSLWKIFSEHNKYHYCEKDRKYHNIIFNSMISPGPIS